MKKLLACCILLALTAGAAAAADGGLNLGWGDCGGLPATQDRVFACNTNQTVSAHILIGSFVAPCCITAAAANEIVIDVQTTGAAHSPSCTGCTAGACIVLNSIKINQPVDAPGGSPTLSAPAMRNWVTWLGGLGAGTNCFLATPARNRTWGSIQSLYR